MTDHPRRTRSHRPTRRAATVAPTLAVVLLLLPSPRLLAQEPQGDETAPPRATTPDRERPTDGPPAAATEARDGEAGEEGFRLYPVPAPDFAAYEPAVAQQLAQVQAALRLVLERVGGEGEVPPAPEEIAAAFADLGRHYHAYGLTDAATASYRNAALLAPEDFRWHHLLGRALQDAGSLDEAADAYQRALELAPDDVPAVLYLAEVRSLQGDPEAAQVLYRRALALDPGASAALAGLGQAALEAGQPARAVELLEAALEANPAATRLHHPLGLAYRELGDRERAQRHLEGAGPVGLKPNDPLVGDLVSLKSGERAHLLRGHMAFRAGHYGEAANAYHRAVDARPDSPVAHVDLATALSRLGYLEGAEDHLRKALALDPDNPNAHYNLGSLLLALGEPAGAGLHLRRAVQLDPSDGGAHLALAEVLRAQGQPTEAFDHYVAALELGVRDDRAALGAADLLALNGQYREALEVLERGFQTVPSSVALIAAQARMLAASPDPSLRDADRALDLAERAWAAETSFPHARTMILALAEAGRCEEAAQWQQRMMDVMEQQGMDPMDPTLAADLARYREGAPCRPPMEGTSAAEEPAGGS